jgi:hypothetical protein
MQETIAFRQYFKSFPLNSQHIFQVSPLRNQQREADIILINSNLSGNEEIRIFRPIYMAQRTNKQRGL